MESLDQREKYDRRLRSLQAVHWRVRAGRTRRNQQILDLTSQLHNAQSRISELEAQLRQARELADEYREVGTCYLPGGCIIERQFDHNFEQLRLLHGEHYVTVDITFVRSIAEQERVLTDAQRVLRRRAHSAHWAAAYGATVSFPGDPRNLAQVSGSPVDADRLTLQHQVTTPAYTLALDRQNRTGTAYTLNITTGRGGASTPTAHTSDVYRRGRSLAVRLVGEDAVRAVELLEPFRVVSRYSEEAAYSVLLAGPVRLASGEKVADFCIVPRDESNAWDGFATKVMLLRFDELEFLRTANCTYISPMPPHERQIFYGMRPLSSLGAEYLFGQDAVDRMIREGMPWARSISTTEQGIQSSRGTLDRLKGLLRRSRMLL